jgi:thiol-disulfide isomerase/thioredoxin
MPIRFVIPILIVVFAVHASGQTTLSGSVLGDNGKPIPMAHVHIKSGMNDTTYLSVPVGRQGTFSVRIPIQGALMVEFSGVNHLPYTIPLVSGSKQTVKLTVTLGTYSYRDDLSGVAFVYGFEESSRGKSVEPARQPNGLYTARVETDKAKFAYQLNNVEQSGRTINGTDSETYEYDGGGDYRSVLTPRDGKVTITFDPAKLLRGSSESKVTFANPSSFAARLLEIHRAQEKRQEQFTKAMMDHRQAGKDMKDFSFDWTPALTQLQTSLHHEKDSLIQQELWMECLDLLSLGGTAPDSSLRQRALREIPPSSPLWVYHLNTVSQLDFDTTGGSAYTERLMKENPDKNLMGSLLFNKLGWARYVGKRNEITLYYDRLMTECGGTRYARMAKERYSSDITIFVGADAPPFSFVSLDDSAVTFINESFKGKYLLLDFWAVWCGPCIRELPTLHKAYERFKGKNFAVLSLSFDRSPQDVVKFREGQWKMPWNHVFVEKGFANPTSKVYEVEGIPKPVLIDPSGKIVAMTMDLRGEQLEKTLAKYLGE